MSKIEEYRHERSSMNILLTELGEDKPRKSDILKYIPEFYLNPSDRAHGLLHTTNTIVIADSLFTLARNRMLKTKSRESVFTDRNRVSVKKALGHHDILHSLNDIDLDHGDKAADWVLENLEDEERVLISSLVRAHVPHDKPGISVLEKLVKDADAADRVRAPAGSNWGLDRNYLRFEETHLLIDPLIQVNLIENRLIEQGYSDNPVELALEAFALTDWIQNE